MKNSKKVEEERLRDYFAGGIAGFLVQEKRRLIQLNGEIHQKPVVPIGLLPSSLQAINKADDSSSDNNIWITISDWFGKQDKGLVVLRSIWK
ncbi:hypothetical protein Dsin_004820 [Dipteronia sinensis]|uniref:Uncharacterized protein n=1 Tax=Dipteronia sinensis TaxID=43782 RepID=A0AAE0AW40_9ROSI|nr:hypothetical protein Dsin_004820 [Dipteronia sinensis]